MRSRKARFQRNARTKRFGAISYSTDGSNTRGGGILRSNMKYVGPTLPDGSANSAKEFNTDGTLVDNPDGAPTGLNSGVINYINKFSEAAYKSLDPVSELFYESIRYFKHIGPTPEYSAGLTTDSAGRLPGVSSWSDPQQFKCQKNFIIAINDANPWLDKKLPARSSPPRRSPALPARSPWTAPTSASRAMPTPTSTSPI
jgi:type IV pilus assembly protein PilY1